MWIRLLVLLKSWFLWPDYTFSRTILYAGFELRNLMSCGPLLWQTIHYLVRNLDADFVVKGSLLTAAILFSSQRRDDPSRGNHPGGDGSGNRLPPRLRPGRGQSGARQGRGWGPQDCRRRQKVDPGSRGFPQRSLRNLNPMLQFRNRKTANHRSSPMTFDARCACHSWIEMSVVVVVTECERHQNAPTYSW